MFTVTVCNLSRDARTAIEGGGSVNLGTLSAEELTALLDQFIEIDALENSDHDPEIRVQSRRERFIIRTGQKKLFLQDARNLAEPAYVLTVAEILAELDGSAAAKRTVPPMAMAVSSEAAPEDAGTAPPMEITPMPVVPARPWPLGLIGVVLALGGYVAYSEWSADRGSSDRADFAPLTAAERQAEDSSLTGVYSTGSEPGQHGIVILGDGKLKLFQVYAQAAPGVVYGSYRFGRVDGKLCLATDQPGGLIKVIDRESLEFCGEIYKRVP
jgi:hypothetical protein